MTAASIARRMVLKHGYFAAALGAAFRWKRWGDALETFRPKSLESKHAAARVTHLAVANAELPGGYPAVRLYVAYDDGTLWSRDEEGRWREVEQPAAPEPAPVVADRPEPDSVWMGAAHVRWMCTLCGVHYSATVGRCANCNTFRPPRPDAVEATQPEIIRAEWPTAVTLRPTEVTR